MKGAVLFIRTLIALCCLCSNLYAADAHPAEENTKAQAQLDFADGLFQRGFFKEAREEYQKFLAHYETHAAAPLAWLRLAESAYALGEYAQALESVRKAAAMELPQDKRYRAAMLEGECLYFTKQYDAAVSVLKGLTEGEAAAVMQARPWYFLGKAYFELGKYSDAEASLRHLLEAYTQSPEAPYAGYLLALVYAAMGNKEKAATAFSSLASSVDDPELKAEARYRAAEIYLSLGWYEAAAKAYEDLRKSFPASEYARTSTVNYAYALYQLQRPEEALAALDAFLKGDPEAGRRVDALYLRGNLLQQMKRYDEALAVYREVQAHEDQKEFAIRAEYKIVQTLYQRGASAEAKSAATAFLQAHPEGPYAGEVAFLLGLILGAEGNYEDALQQFRRVAEKYGDGPLGGDTYFKIAECTEMLGLRAQAAKAYDEFIARFPDHRLKAEALVRAGDNYFDSGDYPQAVARYAQVFDLGGTIPNEETVRYRYAVALLNNKQWTEAVAALERFTQSFPQSSYVVEALYRLGDLYLREIQDPVKAIECFQKVVEREPKGPWGGRALRGLALARYERKDFEQAAQLFLEIVREWPDIPLTEEIYAWAGQWFFDHEQWESAGIILSALLTAVPTYPNPERVLYKIGEAYQRAGKTAKALEVLGKLVQTAPSSGIAVEAQYLMGQIYEAQGDREHAFAAYQAAADANSGEAAARAQFRLAELHEQEGEWDQAARSFMRVAILFLHPELSPEALLRASRAYEKMGNVEQAQRAREELLKDFPDSPQAKSLTQESHSG